MAPEVSPEPCVKFYQVTYVIKPLLSPCVLSNPLKNGCFPPSSPDDRHAMQAKWESRLLRKDVLVPLPHRQQLIPGGHRQGPLCQTASLSSSHSMNCIITSSTRITLSFKCITNTYTYVKIF